MKYWSPARLTNLQGNRGDDMSVPIIVPMIMAAEDHVLNMEVESNTVGVDTEFIINTDIIEIGMALDVGIFTTAGDRYDGVYEVTPKAYDETILATEGKVMDDDVTVRQVPFYVTSNQSGGETVYIAEEA